MSPQFIRPKPASSVKKSEELQAFLDSCRDEWLRDRVDQAFLEIKADYEFGDKVAKDKWPRYYKQTWGINNLFVVMLGPDWRLTYTLVWEGPGITAFCLEILTHKEYDRRFGYRTT
jgi:hypothetical protein